MCGRPQGAKAGRMREVPVDQAVGMVLGHDLTRIVPGQHKGVAYRKGHRITAEDIPGLLDIGKENIFVLDWDGTDVHEDEAALRLAAAAAGPGLVIGEPSEGKVNIYAQHRGLVCVRPEALCRINMLADMVMATVAHNTLADPGSLVAGTRSIGLLVSRDALSNVIDVAEKAYPLLQVRPFRTLAVGLIVTGSEVYQGRIEDGFSPVIAEKMQAFGSSVRYRHVVPDKKEAIVSAIFQVIAQGAQLVVVTGGMSVDPDDRTPGAICDTGAEVVTYGTPVLPGSMLMLAYLGGIPVFGLPGCVMYAKTTVFDLLLPRVLAGVNLTRRDIVALGHGGLCLNCDECRFPRCSFGRA